MKMNPLATRALIAALAALFALGSYLYAQRRAAAEIQVGLQISGAWVRPTPPGAEVGAAYATLRNTGDRPLQVLGVASDVSSTAEIHEMSMAGGVMQMRHLSEGLTLAAGQGTELAPGGTHLMLIGLKRPLVAGESVQLTLQISDGHQLVVSAPVVEK